MISFVVAMDENRGIGKDNDLPWYLPNDLKHFKKTTMGKPIVMGRKTYESIGKPLPGRENIVVTRDQNYEAEGVTIVHSVDDVLKIKAEEMCVIGGSEIFKQFLPVADRLYITEIYHTFDADTYFPEINDKEWKEVSRTAGIVDEKNKYPHDFVEYEKINA
ncbi:dihydrofolate reductase [Fictibacillus phosphorivorans]|uniref:dihydrofolate reductase n=1 Tax=Fictibacillus phosphorivorans TaxID=1221500 RepID=UPI00203AEA19|nr:dihydrofolate reductase [Fictibacillus phosphorivorans]MCM3718798.1 dihydrofolate reductase [Fictibacillus phosphorivorans]MCM3776421.1 dihydrofolate reductase [Fictibacillus phosphorivorans]